MKIRAIITGATGMVGEGVLHECILHPDVEAVLSISRKTCGMRHARLKEILHQDFSDFSGIEKELSGYNAGFFCMGFPSLGHHRETLRKFNHVKRSLVRRGFDRDFFYRLVRRPLS